MSKFSDFKQVEKNYGIGQGGDWLTLKEGENKIRVISEFEVFGNHFNQATKRGIICIGKDKGCEGCASGIKLNVRALGWVIDRADGKVKLFRMPYSIFKAIGELQMTTEYQFDILPEYDMTIKKAGEGLETKYTVIPSRANKEITGEEFEQINKVVKPVSEIIEKMKVKEGRGVPVIEESGEETPPIESYADEN